MYIHTKFKELKLRKAELKDVKIILELIKEIATYEEMLDQVVATEESLKKSLFENKEATVLLVEEEEKIIGYAIYFFNYSTFIGKKGFYLEDIYIKKDYRGKGYGREIFKIMGKIAYEEKCARMEWSCLNWNTPSINFYKSLGAMPMEEWTVYRLTEDKIKELSER